MHARLLGMRLAFTLLCLITLLAERAPAQQPFPIKISDFPHITGEEAIDRALKQSTLTSHGSPFHAVLEISEPRTGNPSYVATIEIYWADTNRYRVTIKSAVFSETQVVDHSEIEEHASGDFYPAWLRNFVTALLNPLPRYKDVLMKPATVVVGVRGFHSCLRRNDITNGITDEMNRVEICLDDQQHIVSSTDFTYSMYFSDYSQFKNKSIARTYTTKTPEEDNLIGRVTTLEPWKHVDPSILKISEPTPRDRSIETSFVSTATNESLIERAPAIDWPSIPEGKLDGHMIIHIVTDRTGQVREAYKFSSDTSIVDNTGRAEALKYKFKPLIVNGVPQQMETPLVIHFTTRVENPYPIVSGPDIEKYATGCGYNPILPAGLFPSGTRFTVRITVNESSRIQLEEWPPGITWSKIQSSGFQVHNCKFEPYLVNGAPSYHKIDFVFTAP